MNIYIPIEIKAREFEGRGLLALAAAERGHTVVLGSKADTRNLCKKKVLPPGILHEKSLTPSESTVEYFRDLNQNGYVITSQDEEAGVTLTNHEEFAKSRYSDESLQYVSKVFCWGKHDKNFLRSFYQNHSDKFIGSGSPRVDYWRRDFNEYFESFEVQSMPKRKKFILIPTNFSLLFGRDSIWNIFARQRLAGYFERDENREFLTYRSQGERLRLAGEYVKMIRTLSKKFPDIIIVVRPHPVELEDAWEKMIGEYPNVIVKREGSVSPWLRNCSLMINNGCTTALEAAASDVPRIAYKPFSMYYEESIPNRVCHTASSLNDVVSLVKIILDDHSLNDASRVQQNTDEIMDERFANLKGKLAADRIVEEWENIQHPIKNEQLTVPEVIKLKKESKKTSPTVKIKRFLAQKKNDILGNSKGKTKKQRLLYNPHKFPELTPEEIDTLISGLRKSLNRFHNVRYKRFGEKSYVFYSSK